MPPPGPSEIPGSRDWTQIPIAGFWKIKSRNFLGLIILNKTLISTTCIGFWKKKIKKSRDENFTLIPSQKIPGSHQSWDENIWLILSQKKPGSQDFAKILSHPGLKFLRTLGPGCHLVAKFATEASGFILWPNLPPMPVAPPGGQISNPCKWNHLGQICNWSKLCHWWKNGRRH